MLLNKFLIIINTHNHNTLLFLEFIIVSLILSNLIINIITFNSTLVNALSQSITIFFFLILLKFKNFKFQLKELKFIYLFLSIIISLADVEIFQIINFNNNCLNPLREKFFAIIQIILLNSDDPVINLLTLMSNAIILIVCKIDFNIWEDVLFFILYFIFEFIIVVLNYKFIRFIQKCKEKDLFRYIYKKLFTAYSFKPHLILRYHEKMKEKFSINFQNSESKNVFNLNTEEELCSFLDKITIFSHRIYSSEELLNKNNISFKQKICSLKEECLTNIKEMIKSNRSDYCSLLDSELISFDKLSKNYFLIRVYYIKRKSQFFLCLSFNEISEKIKLDQIQSIIKYKDTILSNVSHDLRSPLSYIYFIFQKFKDNLQINPNPVHISNMIQLGMSNVKLMETLIHDILDNDQLKMGKFKLNLQDFKLKEILEEIRQIFISSAVEKNIQFIIKTSKNTPETIYSDPIRLKQILINLISNSIKFTKSHGSVTLIAKPHQAGILFAVKDTGLGIPNEIISHLFKPYSSFEGVGGINKEGIGLGLSICKNLVSLLGPFNRIFCSSKENLGSKFWFLIFINKKSFEENKEMIFSAELEKIKTVELFAEFQFDSNLQKKISKDSIQSINEEFEVKIEENQSKKKNYKNDFLSNNEVEISSPSSYKSQQIKTKKLVMAELNSLHENRLGIKKVTSRSSFSQNLNGKSISPSPYLANKPLKLRKFRSNDNIDYYLDQNKSILNADSRKSIKSVKFETSKFLIIDDDVFSQNVIEEYLKYFSKLIHIEKSSNSLEALDWIKNREFDVIFTDLNMPFKSGIELIKELREKEKKFNLNKKTYVVAVSGMEFNSEDNLFDAIIVKPIKREQIDKLTHIKKFF